jgi:hypothetical protein
MCNVELQLYPSRTAVFPQVYVPEAEVRAPPPAFLRDAAYYVPPDGAVAYLSGLVGLPPRELLLPEGMLHWREYALVASLPPLQFSCARCGHLLHWACLWCYDVPSMVIRKPNLAPSWSEFLPSHAFVPMSVAGVDYFLTNAELACGKPSDTIQNGCCGYYGQLGGPPNWLCGGCRYASKSSSTILLATQCTPLFVVLP